MHNLSLSSGWFCDKCIMNCRSVSGFFLTWYARLFIISWQIERLLFGFMLQNDAVLCFKFIVTEDGLLYHWFFETKLDFYRFLAIKNGSKWLLFSTFPPQPQMLLSCSESTTIRCFTTTNKFIILKPEDGFPSLVVRTCNIRFLWTTLCFHLF